MEVEHAGYRLQAAAATRHSDFTDGCRAPFFC